ncbi:cell division protein FtsA [bacterium]|nr:cell division protein FtsA [bacterium]
MPKANLITGLDIGTSEIKALVAKQNSKGNLETLCLVRKPVVRGMRRGVVIEPAEISRILEEISQEIEEKTAERVDSLYVSIGGSHIFCVPSQGTVAVSRADKRISEDDIERVIEAAQTFSLPSNKKILNTFPRNFIVDGEKIKEPLDLEGVRLEVEALIVCGFSPYYKNLTKAVLDAGFSILDIIPSPIAAAASCLTPRQKELGVLLLDIGAGTTNLAVYEEGGLLHLAILPMGSANITNDIAIGLKTDIDTAEKIKKNFGTCILSKEERREKIKIQTPEPISFNRNFLTRIIEARVSEIFTEVNKELKKIGKQEKLPAGVVITGGGAKLPKIVQLAKKRMKLPCKIGRPKIPSNLEKDPTLSVVCGLVLEGAKEGGEEISFGKEVLSKIKKFFKMFIP